MIGNPPYGAKLSDDTKKCCKKNYITAQTIKDVQKGSMDSFSLFIERGFTLLKVGGVSTFIVPLSVTASDAMSGLHKLLTDNCEKIWISSYGDRPKRIFESAEQQVAIIQFIKTNTKSLQILTTSINKRYSSDSLWLLLDNLKFTNSNGLLRNGRIPKIGTEIEQKILSKLFSISSTLQDVYSENGEPIYYRKAGGRYYKIITKLPTNSSAEGSLTIEKKYQDLVGALLSSTLFYWFWLIHSDWHNLRSTELEMMPFPYRNFTDDVLNLISKNYDSYLFDLKEKSQITKTGLRCYFARKSKHLIDQLDDIICPLYGLTPEETEFIKNYEIEFRVDDE